MDPLTVVAALGLAVRNPHADAVIGVADQPAIGEPGPASSGKWAADIAEASLRFSLPEDWTRAVMEVESAGTPGAVSPKGAMGLMQLMPETYAEMRVKYGLGSDPFDPHDNILAGAAYLREMLDRYGASGFLAAYNAGPQRYADIIAGIGPMPHETRDFLAKVGTRIGFGESVAAWSVPHCPVGGLFFAAASGRKPTNDVPAWRQIFVPLGHDPAR